MNYFSECSTLDEAKAAFRKYAKILHPDTGGNKEAMIELQRQYDAFQQEKSDNSSSYSEPYSNDFSKTAEDLFEKQYYSGFYSSNYGYGSNYSSETENQHYKDIPLHHPIHQKLREVNRAKEEWKQNYEMSKRDNDILRLKINELIEDLNKIKERNKNLSKENKELKKAVSKTDDLKRDVEFFKSRLDMVIQPEKIVLDKIKEYLKEL